MIEKKAAGADDEKKKREGPSDEELAAKKREFLEVICRPTDLSCESPPFLLQPREGRGGRGRLEAWVRRT